MRIETSLQRAFIRAGIGGVVLVLALSALVACQAAGSSQPSSSASPSGSTASAVPTETATQVPTPSPSPSPTPSPSSEPTAIPTPAASSILSGTPEPKDAPRARPRLEELVGTGPWLSSANVLGRLRPSFHHLRDLPLHGADEFLERSIGHADDRREELDGDRSPVSGCIAMTGKLIHGANPAMTAATDYNGTKS